jgi:hypothetical protein
MRAEAVIAGLDWASIETELDREGYATLPGLLSESQVNDLAAPRNSTSNAHRVLLASEGLGNGDLYFFSQTLPALVADFRTSFYKRLVMVADRWNGMLGQPHRYPRTLDAFLLRNRKAGHIFPQSNLIRLRQGGYQALHRRNDGEQFFPMQLVALLSQPGEDFTGGEFVMTEQRPRMQSRPMVVPLHKGDMAIIAVAQRPHRGTNGYYRVNSKHAISRVHSGERVGLEILFHDAKSRWPP